jgi:hypothetical protein
MAVSKPRVAAPSAVPPGDELVTGTGDTAGWHVFAAAAGDGWRWHALATLRPANYADEKWIGQQCLTGDGRYVIVVAAPWHANNSAPGIDRGAFAYAVDAHNGSVRPLASGVSLAYFDPGCGAGDQLALTSYLGQDEATTRVAVVNAASGAVLRSVAVRGELTSAVPVGSAIDGARGAALVRIAGGRETVLARGPGQVFDVRANSSGGVDFLVAHGRTAGVWQLAGASARRVGSGPLTQVRLFSGHNGRNLVTGTGPGAAPGLISVRVPSRSLLLAASLDGQATVSQPLGGLRLGQPGRLTLASGGPGQPVSAPLPHPVTRAATVLPGLNLGAQVAGPTAPAALAGRRGLSAAVTTTAPACAVPRNDIWTQVPQPNSAQIRWAVQQAVRGWLVPGNIPARPADPQDYMMGDSQQLPQFYPSQDFPPPAIAGHPGAVVPPQVIYGILAQESNWNQASWHALAGYGGNPLIANYYGSANPAGPTDINFGNADCGYGIAQITDLMKAGAASISTQDAIAVDYAENIAAAVSNLAGKWNQLAGLRIKMNNGDPARIENWYAAIWAYNSGVHMTANGDPANGLGWHNNPANPIYLANRHPFLCADSSCTSYGDAGTPQDWPYQEKVLGWIEGGQFDPNNPTSFRFAPLGQVLKIPSSSVFCGLLLNNCDPTVIGSSSSCTPGDDSCDPCPAEDSTCWWKQPAQWADCSAGCTSETFTISSATAPEPAPTTRPVVCDEINSPSDLPSGALIVADTALAGQNPQSLAPNVVGCPDAATRNWHDSGSFDLEDSSGTQLSAADVASIDLHQLGAGFGGHTWFTHTRPASDASHEVVGRWTPSIPAAGIYEIRVFIPAPGATTTAATYTVDGSYNRTVNQNNYNNQWVSIGYFPMSPGQSVTLGSVTPAADASQGADIAFNAVAFTPVPAESYVALGDSYASGEGTGGPWDEGTDAQAANGAQQDDLCHRSPDNYAAQYAALTQTFAGSAVDLACSGSNLWDLDHVSYSVAADGTVTYPSSSPTDIPNPDQGGTSFYGEPESQVDILKRIPSPKLVTVDLGGNDTGFVSILTNCISLYYSYLATGGNAPTCQQHDYTNANGSDKVTNTINGLKAPVIQALGDIKAAVPAGTRIVLLTYPQIFNSGSDTCALMQPGDVSWLMAKAQQLDQMLIQAANTAGVSYLDEFNAFQGHELCTSTPWVRAPDNLFKLPFDSNPSLMDNYFHPLAAGYTKEAQDLKTYLSSIP